MKKKLSIMGQIFTFAATISVCSCRFNYSPLVIRINQHKLNDKNLQLIKNQINQKKGPLRVAFISDIHNYYDDLQQQIKKINNSGPFDFVIVTGDLTNLGYWQEFDQAQKMLGELNFPFLVAIGNHDFLSNGREIFLKLFGKTDLNFNYKKTTFVLLNNNSWESPEPTPNLSTIEEILKQSDQPFKILVAHIPFDDEERFENEDIQRWVEMLERYGVNYFINGHNHQPAEKKWQNFYQVTVGSPERRQILELVIDEKNIYHRRISF